MSTYTGPVCYGPDGWHYSVDDNDQPEHRLVLEDDGTYRYATDGDTDSWHDRTHRNFVNVEMQ